MICMALQYIRVMLAIYPMISAALRKGKVYILQNSEAVD